MSSHRSISYSLHTIRHADTLSETFQLVTSNIIQEMVRPRSGFVPLQWTTCSAIQAIAETLTCAYSCQQACRGRAMNQWGLQVVILSLLSGLGIARSLTEYREMGGAKCIYTYLKNNTWLIFNDSKILLMIYKL